MQLTNQPVRVRRDTYHVYSVIVVRVLYPIVFSMILKGLSSSLAREVSHHVVLAVNMAQSVLFGKMDMQYAVCSV